MKVSELYENGPITGRDVFIIGTGRSMTVFPRNVLRDKCCILLNDATRYFQELGPIAFANNKSQLKFASPRITHQIVKARLKFDPNPERDDNHVPWGSPDLYCFSYREPPWDKVSHHDERTLFKEPCHYWAPQKGSVSSFAVQFALWCGVRSITLVGCDCNDVAHKGYVSGKKGQQYVHDYYAYQVGLSVLGRHAAKRGVPMLSLTPFFGLGWHDQQFEDQLQWRRQFVSEPNGDLSQSP